MVRKILAVVAVAVCGLCLPAWAGEGYVGLSYLDSSAEFVAGSQTLDSSDSGWKIFGGYNPIKFFGVEVTYYDMGNFTDTQGNASIDADVSIFDVSGRGILPLGKRFDLTGKLGFSSVKTDLTTTVGSAVSNADAREWELLLGFGFDLKLGERLAIRGDYETWDVDTSLDAWSLGLVIRFGES